VWREEFNHLRPPVDNQLKGSSSWVNFVTKRDRQTPEGWAETAQAQTLMTERGQ